MEIIILISLDVLFLILLTIILTLNRKVERINSRCMRHFERSDGRIRGFGCELEQLQEQMKALNILTESEEAQGDEELLKARVAEKCFTEGIASILSYGLDVQKTAKEDKQ